MGRNNDSAVSHTDKVRLFSSTLLTALREGKHLNELAAIGEQQPTTRLADLSQMQVVILQGCIGIMEKGRNITWKLLHSRVIQGLYLGCVGDKAKESGNYYSMLTCWGNAITKMLAT